MLDKFALNIFAQKAVMLQEISTINKVKIAVISNFFMDKMPDKRVSAVYYSFTCKQNGQILLKSMGLWLLAKIMH